MLELRLTPEAIANVGFNVCNLCNWHWPRVAGSASKQLDREIKKQPDCITRASIPELDDASLHFAVVGSHQFAGCAYLLHRPRHCSKANRQ
jgi:hypothetical protein